MAVDVETDIQRIRGTLIEAYKEAPKQWQVILSLEHTLADLWRAKLGVKS